MMEKKIKPITVWMGVVDGKLYVDKHNGDNPAMGGFLTRKQAKDRFEQVVKVEVKPK